jgi:hypothetical protein
MKVGLAALFGAIVMGCATSNPIDRFVANPPQEASRPIVVSLPRNASLGQLVGETLGTDTRYKILESRIVYLGGRVSPTAVLVESEDRQKRIVLIGYIGEDRGGWWAYVYDSK